MKTDLKPSLEKYLDDIVHTDDIEATLRQIEAAGGKGVMPRTEGPPVGAEHIRVFTTFLDPAGNKVGLVEPPRP